MIIWYNIYIWQAHCGPGYKLNDSEDNCTACGFGNYKTDTGNTPCQACSGNQLTISSAASNSEACQGEIHFKLTINKDILVYPTVISA